MTEHVSFHIQRHQPYYGKIFRLLKIVKDIKLSIEKPSNCAKNTQKKKLGTKENTYLFSSPPQISQNTLSIEERKKDITTDRNIPNT